MTRREHFEQWMLHNHPHIMLIYQEHRDFYEGEAFLPYQAWKEAPLRRPCEKGQITKEQLKALKENDDPASIVDRLNGWYSQTSEPYKVPEIQEEAAREIVRLREEIERLRAAPAPDEGGWIEHDGRSSLPDAELIVDIKYRDESTNTSGFRAWRLDWSHDGSSTDIIAYRLHK